MVIIRPLLKLTHLLLVVRLYMCHIFYYAEFKSFKKAKTKNSLIIEKRQWSWQSQSYTTFSRQVERSKLNFRLTRHHSSKMSLQTANSSSSSACLSVTLMLSAPQKVPAISQTGWLIGLPLKPGQCRRRSSWEKKRGVVRETWKGWERDKERGSSTNKQTTCKAASHLERESLHESR